MSTEAAGLGPDRIARTSYDNANRPTKLTLGVGSATPVDEWTRTYSANGQLATLADAAGNLTTYEYDGFDRRSRMRFPNASGGGSSTTDDELYAYDANSNVTALTLRDNAVLATAYDNLNRATATDAPGTALDVSYSYDLFGRLLTQSAGGQTLSFSYDQLSRNLSQQSSVLGTVSYQYDLASRRTRMTWPDAFYVSYDYDMTGAVTAIRENGAASGAGVLATYAYDGLGRRTSASRGNGTVTNYGFDAAFQLSNLSHDLAGTAQDQSYSLGYNPVGQLTSRTGSNAAYQWTPLAPGNAAYADNGLNQYTNVGGSTPAYDGRGNLTSVSGSTYSYDIFDRLIGATPSGGSAATLSYDPAGRLYETVSGANTTRFLYDGAAMIAEFNSSNALQRRYVHGPGMDEPLLWYEGAGTSDRRYLLSDQLGSVVAVNGASTTINAYDEYGQRAATNSGRFQYTGQAWLNEAQLYHYKARAYSPTLGRFLQTDPILHAGGMNLYAYVQNDPVNLIDPFGLEEEEPCVLPYCGYGSGSAGFSFILERLREIFEPIYDAGRSAGRNAGDAVGEAGEAAAEAARTVNRATQCDTFRVGALAGGAMGFGGEFQVGAQFDRSQNELSGFVDFEPAVGEGGALQGFVEHEFGDGGQGSFSPGSPDPGLRIG